jgi:hypothetical protein
VEAIHFDYRNFEFTDAPIPHHFHIVPDEDSVTSAVHPWGDTGNNPNDPNGQNRFANSRSGHYLQIVPDSGQNKGNCPTCPNENVGFPPYAEYKVQINTVGTYQLYLRQVGWDGSSDSFFAQILEFAPPGPGPNFYRYAPNPDSGDFATLRNIPSDQSTENQGWSGYAAPAPIVDGGDNNSEKPAIYNITKPGLYTVRLSQREDGAAVDAFILQLATLPVPTNPGPNESAISTTAPPYVRAVDPTPGQQQVPPDNGFACQIVDAATAVDGNSIKLVIDGKTVTPDLGKTNKVTYVTYNQGLLTSGAAVTWSVIFSDTSTPANTFTNTFPFTVLPYSPIPPEFAVPSGSVDTTKPGFLVYPYQTDAAQPNSLDWTEDQVAGLHGPNTADLSGATNGAYTETGVINYDIASTASADNFLDDSPFPGIPGTGGGTDNATEQILTWLKLDTGVYRMVVNSDDGFKVSVGPDPHDKAGVVLGSFDGGRGFADSLFIFVVGTNGYYPFRLLWENGNGGATLEWFTQNVFARKALVNSTTNGTLAVPAFRAGPSFPYVSRISPTPTGFSLDYTDNGGIVVNKDSMKVTLDGTGVSATVTKAASVTTIAYTATAVFVSGSTHRIGLSYNDSATPPVAHTRFIDFTVETYATLTPDYAVGPADTSKPGFTVHANRIDDQDANGAEIIIQPNTIAFTEQQLAGKVTNSATGQPFPNVAIKNTDGTFTYIEPAVINYSRDITGNPFGDFVPDVQMPGIMGTTDLETANAALEILTYVSLPAGLLHMGVNSDDGFRLSSATNVVDPHNALTLGEFDGGRGSADTLFDIYVQTAGIYPARLIWENGGGDANVEWFSVTSDGTKILINDTATAGAIRAWRAAAPGTIQLPPKFTSVTLTSANMIISWTGGGTLQSAPDIVAGPWTPVAGASSPATIPTTGARQFFRVKQ